MNAVATVTAMRSQPDAELVALVRAGWDEAFEELYRRYRPRIGAFVHRMVHDAGRAEDLTQDAFVAALRRMRETECEIVFRPWIYEIARNAAIDMHRRAGRADEVSFDSDVGLPASDMLRYGAAPGPDAVVIGRETFAHFRDALEELSEPHHEIIVLRELEGLSYREIGERMNLSEAAVESTLFRARRKLAEEYAQAGSGRRCGSVALLMARIVAGSEAERDRLRVARHARRCTACRRQALALGIEPAPSRAARVAAFVPVLGAIRRRAGSDGTALTGAAQQGVAAGVLIAPGAPGIVSKAVSVLAATAVVAGGGATLGGVGPLAVDRAPSPVQKQTREPRPAAAPVAPRATPTPAPRGFGDAPAKPTAPTSPPPSRADGDPRQGLPQLPPALSNPSLPEVDVPPVNVPPVDDLDLGIPKVDLPTNPPAIPALPAARDLPVAGAAVAQVEELAGQVVPQLP
jgi:RNA polymerase sigma factor (sigma-70 family)